MDGDHDDNATKSAPGTASGAPSASLVSNLFRHEAGRLTASLVRYLGPGQYDVAEEIVQETLVHALERWKFGDIPDNPAAWLTTVAKHRAIDLLRRRATATKNSRDVAAQFVAHAAEQNVETHFAQEVDDDVLRMMFSCCAPPLSRPAQIALILKALGGFSTGEIAAALLITPAATEKRLSRAKAALREHGLFDVTGATNIQERLGAVHQAIYLLFNEGYHGAHPEQVIQQDLCLEALRLGDMLVRHPATIGPATHGLMALMCLLAARLAGRTDDAGELMALEHQDRSKWNPGLIRAGFAHLEQATKSDAPDALNALSGFTLEAALASIHAAARTWAETDWDKVVAAYDVMVRLADSPIVRLNRAIAVGERDGPSAGLSELNALESEIALKHYPFLPAAKARLQVRAGEVDAALTAYGEAIALARNPAEVRFLERARAAAGQSSAGSTRI